MHVFDQKLLNLELYTKEKILDLLSQINLIKQICKLPINDSLTREKTNIDLNKVVNLPNKPLTNVKYKTFNNSSINNKNYQESFYSIKNKENISNNNDFSQNTNNTNNNINNYNNVNNPCMINNTVMDKKRCSLKDLNIKPSLLNQKITKKNNTCSNSNIYNNIFFNNMNNMRTNNGIKNDIIEETSTKIIQNINNDINCKFLKEIEKKVENGNLIKNCLNNDDLNYKSFGGSNRNFFAHNNPMFKGTEIKLVDLNKLVNNQFQKNRLNPINDNDYFAALNGKK